MKLTLITQKLPPIPPGWTIQQMPGWEHYVDGDVLEQTRKDLSIHSIDLWSRLPRLKYHTDILKNKIEKC